MLTWKRDELANDRPLQRRPRKASRRATALFVVLASFLSVFAIGTGTAAAADSVRFNGCRAGNYNARCTITVTSYTSSFQSRTFSCHISNSSSVDTCEIFFLANGKWQATRVFR